MVSCTSPSPNNYRRCLQVVLGAVLSLALFAEVTLAQDAAYLRTISQRAEKIVVTLNIADASRSNSVHGILLQQYRDLNEIHSVRDKKIRTTVDMSDFAKAGTVAQAARDEAKPKLDILHGEFLARLGAELSPAQVDKVKDGMTYGVVPLTYGVYLKMYPDLKDEEKRQIMAWLVEAREIAMDGSTSQEKHAVFGKYKGRINNYLSKAGYDAKKGEANLKQVLPSNQSTKSK